METLKNELQSFYGRNIYCCLGSAIDFKSSLPKQSNNIEFFAYLHKRLNVVVVWDIGYRRNQGTNDFRYLSIRENIVEEKMNGNFCSHAYRPVDNYVEKILFFEPATLKENLLLLSELFMFNAEDDGFPSNSHLVDSTNNRSRISVSRLNRDKRFRESVLQRYHCQCAICRCNEKHILEAAHIIAVSENGSDDLENGICLCANHHKMLDNNLIRIDFNKLTLSFVAETVKLMPWYEQFIKKHRGVLLRGE